MLFNSIPFAVFLPIVFLIYWFVANRNLLVQNLFLLVASYVFYAFWDWRFLFLLLFSTLLDYYTGMRMAASAIDRNRKIWLWLSITINLGFLGIFKYFNFFASNFSELMANLGLEVSPWTLSVILPVGISFYTFHGLSYVFDIFNNRIKPEDNFINYAVFVSFFPLLVAGPIERATHLLPQIQKARTFNYTQAVDGMRQILWGLFKKIVVADNCAVYSNLIFNHPEAYSGSAHLLGAFFFAIQIYCDFSGYSDIALGSAKLLGIELLRNFSFPYFSRDIAEFWRRWHISLSSWFRDYLYIPMGGSRQGVWVAIRNTFVIFLVSGFWHGANWTFVFWGFLNALFILPSIILKTHRTHLDIVAPGKIFPSMKEFASILFTFGLTLLAWIFFRSKTMGEAISYILPILSGSLFRAPEVLPTLLLSLIVVLLIVEWSGREGKHALERVAIRWPSSVRWLFYGVIVLLIFLEGGKQQTFIYFQF